MVVVIARKTGKIVPKRVYWLISGHTWILLLVSLLFSLTKKRREEVWNSLFWYQKAQRNSILDTWFRIYLNYWVSRIWSELPHCLGYNYLEEISIYTWKCLDNLPECNPEKEYRWPVDEACNSSCSTLRTKNISKIVLFSKNTLYEFFYRIYSKVILFHHFSFGSSRNKFFMCFSINWGLKLPHF